MHDVDPAPPAPEPAERRCRRAEQCVDREKHLEQRSGITDCPCSCHGAGPYAACDADGGCGHLHAAHDVAVWVGAPITVEHGLCPPCRRSIAHDIGYLRVDVVELTQQIGAGGTSSGDRVAATREPPTPLRLSHEALRAAIDDEAQTWAAPVAEQLGIDWPSTTQLRRMRLGPRVERALNLLRETVDTLVELPAQEVPVWAHDGRPAHAVAVESEPGPGGWAILERTPDGALLRATEPLTGLEGALRLARLHQHAYSLLGRTRLVHRLPARCPWCWQRTLVRENGADHVQCESGRCRGRVIEERHYDWLVRATLAVEQQEQTELEHDPQAA